MRPSLATTISTWIACFVMMTGGWCLSQPSKLIDLNRVSKVTQKKLKKMGVDQYTRYDQFELSVNGDFDPTRYRYNHMAFVIERPLDEVWFAYLLSNPSTAWSGKSLKFDFAYSKRHQQIYYRDDVVPNAHEGMGVFILMNILYLTKITGAMEITRIDHSTKEIDYTYLEKNTSHGRQFLRFTALTGAQTRLDHDTYSTSGIRWRDWIYPKIHEKLVFQFHQNVMTTIQAPISRIE
jgi:hypothetical protein